MSCAVPSLSTSLFSCVTCVLRANSCCCTKRIAYSKRHSAIKSREQGRHCHCAAYTLPCLCHPAATRSRTGALCHLWQRPERQKQLRNLLSESAIWSRSSYNKSYRVAHASAQLGVEVRPERLTKYAYDRSRHESVGQRAKGTRRCQSCTNELSAMRTVPAAFRRQFVSKYITSKALG